MCVCVEVIRHKVKDTPILTCRKCGLECVGLSKNKVLCDSCFKGLKEDFKWVKNWVSGKGIEGNF